MRFLADENFPGLAVSELRKRGHDVVWILTDAPGISDEEVLALAKNERRVLLTFDKDFGELVFLAGKSASSGVVLFRMSAKSPEYVAETAARVLEYRDDWIGHFAVVEDTRVRLKKIPEKQFP
ncbi:MAG: DUF5615 family PIN-like protein [Leptolyngbya sp.]|nr:DUF5615 family PIN-like protein [Candidatus Melainabacteria bacterium]